MALLLAVQAAMKHGGRVLVHCSQGVSRSAALAIAYLMWQRNEQYDPVFQGVKAIRGVANPNIGFTCQVCRTLKLSSIFLPGQTNRELSRLLSGFVMHPPPLQAIVNCASCLFDAVLARSQDQALAEIAVVGCP